MRKEFLFMKKTSGYYSKRVTFGCLLALVLSLSVGCGSNEGKDSGKTSPTSTPSITTAPTSTEDTSGDTALENSGEDQLAQPTSADITADIYIKDFGVVKVKFFPKAAPKAVENFVTHSKNGYYNGLTFHRIIDDFMIQGGDPTGTGAGGKSIWGNEFENEVVENLAPIRGALCMANAGPDTNGSQFFIVQKKSDSSEDMSTVEMSDTQKSLLEEKGGTPWLLGDYTIFGQVYEGLDIIDKAAAVETDDYDKPATDVIIEKIEVHEADENQDTQDTSDSSTTEKN